MVRKRWAELSPTARRAIVAGAAVEGLLKTVALIDLARRPSAEIRGSKKAWALGTVFVNSAGAVPIAYLFCAADCTNSQNLTVCTVGGGQPRNSSDIAIRLGRHR